MVQPNCKANTYPEGQTLWQLSIGCWAAPSGLVQGWWQALITEYIHRYISIITPISEHQPTVWPSFLMDLHFFFQASVILCLKQLHDEHVFALVASYVTGVMCGWCSHSLQSCAYPQQWLSSVFNTQWSWRCWVVIRQMNQRRCPWQNSWHRWWHQAHLPQKSQGCMMWDLWAGWAHCCYCECAIDVIVFCCALYLGDIHGLLLTQHHACIAQPRWVPAYWWLLGGLVLALSEHTKGCSRHRLVRLWLSDCWHSGHPTLIDNNMWNNSKWSVLCLHT